MKTALELKGVKVYMEYLEESAAPVVGLPGGRVTKTLRGVREVGLRAPE